MNTNECHVPDLQDIEFHWEDPYLNKDVIFQPGVNSSFPSNLLQFSEGFFCTKAQSQNLKLDDEEDKQNSSTTTAVSERPNRPTALLQSFLFGKKSENSPECRYKNLFQ